MSCDAEFSHAGGQSCREEDQDVFFSALIETIDTERGCERLVVKMLWMFSSFALGDPTCSLQTWRRLA